MIFEICIPTLDWPKNEISKADISERRRYLNSQTFNAFVHEQNQNFMRLSVVGRNNGVPGIALLFFDIYSKYVIEYYEKTKDSVTGFFVGPRFKISEFVACSPILDTMPDSVKNKFQEDINLTLQSYDRHIFPLLKFSRTGYVVDDDISLHLLSIQLWFRR